MINEALLRNKDELKKWIEEHADKEIKYKSKGSRNYSKSN